MKNILQNFIVLACVIHTCIVNAQTINIPDSKFKLKLLEANTGNNTATDSFGLSIAIDVNGDNEIQQSEALNVYKLNVSGEFIFSLEGIQYFTHLQILSCSDNRLSNLDVSDLLDLKELYCDGNDMVGINLIGLNKLEVFDCNNNEFGGFDLNAFGLVNLKKLNCANNFLSHLHINDLTNLTDLQCGNNGLRELNVSNLLLLKDLNCFNNRNLNALNINGLTNLQSLNCGYNNLYSLNIDSLTNLKTLSCFGNQLTQLNISNLINLESLYCSDNKLTLLDVHRLTKLRHLYCENNKLTSLNLNGLRDLIGLSCHSNKLKSIYLKDGFNNSNLIPNGFIIHNNPDLQFICADESELVALQEAANSNGYTTVSINSFCGAYLEGAHYVLNGNVKFDSNNNGCTPSDPVFPFLKININSTTNNGYAYSDANGNYIMVFDNSTYTITPQMPNSYFTCTPLSSTITFPEDTMSQQFCITPNGTHHDVSVTIVPVSAPRPGFSVTYKIILKNKGNQIENGTILFNYDDDLQDYISSTVIPTTLVSGSLSFAFSNLQLFETREISITMRTNTPTDNPAVNAGDILQLSVTANLDNGVNDEYFKDNFQNIQQTVVGSFDPNDKTCLEGEIITPNLIGDYVHYLIRFENTGTANAENIVVTDFIDLTKFDISTLDITSASHNCKTLISNGNKVQFVFNNIDLPFTEPLKHGYVAFKIKTKNNLAIGDSLKNHADIYFDYNLPITTNTATSRITTITGVNTNTAQNGSLSIYPNPVSEQFFVNFESPVRQAITLKIIGTDGNVVYEQYTSHINKSQFQLRPNLPGGIYLISITGDKQQYVQKFIVVK